MGRAALVLDGEWSLTYKAQVDTPASSIDDARARDYETVRAAVPGCVEADLMTAGVIPDLYVGANIERAWELEYGDWWYSREFDLPADWPENDNVLIFDGLDTIADVYVNDALVGRARNMLVPHEFSADLSTGTNRLVVHLISPMRHAEQFPYAPLDRFVDNRQERAWVRKAPHMYGWDIAPRLVSAGIWRHVRLESRPSARLADVFIDTADVDVGAETADVVIHYEIDGWPARCDVRLVVAGRERVTGTRLETLEIPVHFRAGRIEHRINGAKLWWPNGYGEPCLYDITVRLLVDGNAVDEREVAMGLRCVEVVTESSRTPATEDFRVRINHEPVFLMGTNWVPLDALHCRDAERLGQATALMSGLGGNIVRCWGGNVYESDAFYAWCDAHGYLVWQDFALACGRYPTVEPFLQTMRDEVAATVRRLRQHPSILLWCGNNENDRLWVRDGHGMDPNDDLLSRDIIRQVVQRHDPRRHYLPSSPFYSTNAFQTHAALPEEHLWGPRASFKDEFYTAHGASFVSEIGYHGCPSASSLRRFLPADECYPDPTDAVQSLHSTDNTGPPSTRPYRRVQLMMDQARLMFGSLRTDLNGFVDQSQIVQAEALKFFVERARGDVTGHSSGIIWWNLLDCWPQTSDAVVDYYLDRKLAYHYLRRAQQSLTVVAGEARGWERDILVANHSRRERTLDITVSDLRCPEPLWTGTATAAPNSVTSVHRLPISRRGTRCLLMTWADAVNPVGAEFDQEPDTPGKRWGNHYVEAFGELDLDEYYTWLPLIGQLSPTFDPAPWLDH